MRSKTSWFNRTLFVKNLTRFWPVWALYAVLWAFVMPVNLLSSVRYGGLNTAVRFAERDVLYMGQATVLTTLLFGVLAAMCVFSYLYNSRSVGMYHALPLRREGLFLTSYLSGLSFLAGPAVLVFLLTLAAEAAAGHANAGALSMWLTVHLLCILFFYSFAVFCAMFTGNILALPAFYGILSGLAAAIYAILDGLLGQFLYGYDRVDWALRLMLWLTPSAHLYSGLQVWEDVVRPYENEAQALLDGSTRYVFQGLHIALAYALVGVALTLCALCLYRRRRLESAGDVVSVGWVRPVFKYGVGACSALVGGVVLYSLFGQSGSAGSPLELLAWMLPCGAMGYFVAEMLLQKSFRVLGRWKGCVALLAGVALGVGCIWLDPFGFTQWTPDPDKVVYVKTHVNSYPGDGANSALELTAPGDIALFVQAHGGMIGEEETWRRGLWYDWSGELTMETLPDGRSYRYSDWDSLYLNIEYGLAGGGSVSRRYNVLARQEDLADPGSYAAILEGLLNRPEHRMEMYGFPTSETARLVAGDLDVFNRETWELEGVTVPAAGLERLYAAIRSDLAAGRLGVRYLIEDQARMENCYYNDLTLGFYDPKNGDAYAMAEEKYGTRAALSEKDLTNESVTITLQASATDTLAVLEELGVIDEERTLTTWAEFRIWQDSRD